MSLLDTASLIVTPNGYKEGTLYSVIPSDGSGDMSVVRATTATRVNSSGLVELVPYNLLTWSEDLTQWTANADIATTQLVANPLTGLNNATKITSVSSPTDPWVAKISSAGNGTYTYSVYLWTDSGQPLDVVLFLYNNAVSEVFTFPITLTTTPTRYQYTSTFVNTGGSLVARIDLSSTATQFIYAYGAQLVEGTLPKDYQKTETRINIPRLDYSNGTCPSLLVEPQRTNLIYPSIPTLSGGGTLVQNATISPDGNTNANSFVPSSNGFIYCNVITTTAQSYTFSLYLKGTVNGQKVQLSADLQGILATLTLTTEWERYTVSFTGVIGLQNFYILSGGYLSPSEFNLFYFWGWQIEAGSYPTSYIPTTSASVTRNADVVSKTGISSLIGQTEGTLFFDGMLINKQNQYVTLLNTNKDVLSISSFALFFDATNWKINFSFYKGNGTYDPSFSIASSQNFYNDNRVKIAVRYKSGDSVMYINGVQQATSTTAFTINGTKSELFIADAVLYYGYQEPTECNAVALWKQGLTNTQLAQLTTI